MNPTDWITVKDVCLTLSINRATWYRWVADESRPTPPKVPNLGTRMTRYVRGDIEAFKKASVGQSVGSEINET